MKQTLTSYWDATCIGFVFSGGVALLLWIAWPASWSFAIFAVPAPITLCVFGVAGAVLGKLLLKSRNGTWLGAGLMVLLLGLWLYLIAINPPLD